MSLTVFSAIPKGVSIRRLDQKRRAQNQPKGYKFSAWRGNKIAYGNTIRGAIRALGEDVHVHLER